MNLQPFTLSTVAYFLGILVGVLLATWYYRRHRRPVPKGPFHPNAGRFCHICGADAYNNERCDAGLHS